MPSPHDLRALRSSLDHPECVAWNPLSECLVHGTESGELWSFDPRGMDSRKLATAVDGFILGITVDHLGNVYACDMMNGCVHRWDPDAGVLERFADGSSGDRMRVPNYAAFGDDGVLYVTDSGSCWDGADGTIWAVRPDGCATRAIDDALAFPNGLALTPDRRSLMCLETFPPRLVRFDIPVPGRLAEMNAIADLDGTVPDGLAFTANGDVLVACYRPDVLLVLRAPDYASAEVWVEDRHGRLLAGPSNLCFFGAELDRLAVANVGGNHLTEVITDYTGLPVFRGKEIFNA